MNRTTRYGRIRALFGRLRRRSGEAGQEQCPCLACAIERGVADAEAGAGFEAVPLPVLLGALGLRAAAGPPQEQGLSASREWVPTFADRIGVGDVLAVPAGVLARREVEARVMEVRRHPEAVEGVLGPLVTLLLVDPASGEVFSPTVSVHQGFRVAPAVPDSPAALGGVS